MSDEGNGCSRIHHSGVQAGRLRYCGSTSVSICVNPWFPNRLFSHVGVYISDAELGVL